MSDATDRPPADDGGSLGDAASHFATVPGGSRPALAATSMWTR